MVVYIDMLFLINAAMDFVTLTAAARFGGVSLQVWRALLAAAAGGLYAVAAIYAPYFAWPFCKLLVNIGLCCIAYGTRRHWVRLCFLHMLIAASFAGLALVLSRAAGKEMLFGAVYLFMVPARVLLVVGLTGYAVSAVLLRGDALHGPLQRETETVTVCVLHHELPLRLLHDTGCALVEPLTGKPAVVISRRTAVQLTGEMGRCFTQTDAAACLMHLPPVLAKRSGLLPYQTVGTEYGFMLYVRPDYVQRADGSKLDCVLAIGWDQNGFGGCDGLIGV